MSVHNAPIHRYMFCLHLKQEKKMVTIWCRAPKSFTWDICICRDVIHTEHSVWLQREIRTHSKKQRVHQIRHHSHHPDHSATAMECSVNYYTWIHHYHMSLWLPLRGEWTWMRQKHKVKWHLDKFSNPYQDNSDWEVFHPTGHSSCILHHMPMLLECIVRMSIWQDRQNPQVSKLLLSHLFPPYREDVESHLNSWGWQTVTLQKAGSSLASGHSATPLQRRYLEMHLDPSLHWK